MTYKKGGERREEGGGRRLFGYLCKDLQVPSYATTDGAGLPT